MILGLDTATPATTVALLGAGGEVHEARHDPRPGERPGHGTRLLALIDAVMAEAGAEWAEVETIATGIGPGLFTGLRIGVSTARALGQARALPLAGVSSLAALAAGAREALLRPVTAVIDARRGEVFAVAFDAAGRALGEPAAVRPSELARRLSGALAVGDGSVRFREELEAGGAEIPADDSPLHRLSAVHVCRLGAEAEPVGPDGLLPSYVRAPDAELR